MDVGTFIVHVHDTIVGLVVLGARPWLLAAHPARLSACEGLAWRRFAEDPPIELGAGAIVVEIAGRGTVRRQVQQPCPKVRIDIFVQDLGGGVDMGVGIIHPEAVFHRFSPWVCYDLALFLAEP